MNKNGLNIVDISGGSSPTGRYVAQIEGVTEVRPGTYIFYDYMQVNEKSCSVDQFTFCGIIIS